MPMSDPPLECDQRDDDLVALVAGLHRCGNFIRDPAPSVLERTENGSLRIADRDLETRRDRDCPDRALTDLWSLMRGESPRVKIESARRYVADRGLKEFDLDQLLRDFRRRDVERSLEENRDFAIVEAGGLVWHTRRELLRDEHRRVLTDPDAHLRHGPDLLKDGRGTTVARTPGEGVLKRFNLKRYRNLLTNQIAGSRARLAFQQAYHLETMGIRTARALAFADRTRFGCIYRSYLLMELVPHVQPGATAFRAWEGRRPDLKRRVLVEAGRTIGRLHDAGFSNRDLKASNLLVNDAGDLWVIDLDGVAHQPRVPEEQRLKNLRRMVRDLPRYGHLSRREALTFLRAYARAVRRGDAKGLFRRLSSTEETIS
jgi:tRNA A-37 threonylcarbamoyl transferase component Bud32